MSAPSLQKTAHARLTWAEVSLTALRHNFRTVQDYVAPGATVCAVVKCDAYGHGLVPCAKALQEEGAMWFGVTDTNEGVQLREAGISGRILVMSGFWRGDEEAVVHYDLTPAVWEWNHIELLEDAAERLGRGGPVPVHLKIDTGMARLGISLEDIAQFAQVLRDAQHVVLEGVFTHFASSEVIDSLACTAQIARFDDAVTALIESGLSPVYYHLANSAAIITRHNSWKNFVRPGLSLYGYFLPVISAVTGNPDTSYELPVVPALTWKTRILAIRDVPARQPIGYNGAYVTQAPARIAVLPVGYGDGLSRHLSSRGRVIVRDDVASIVGNVSMDLTTIDVTGIPGVDVGQEVIILGESGRHKISAWEHASLATTIPYEILTGISKRVERRYVE